MMSMKQHMLSALREQYNRWEQLLASLKEEEITAIDLPSEWAVKDIVVHLWAWQQRSIARCEAALLDRQPVFPDWPTELDPDAEGSTDSVNDWIFETHRQQPWPIVHQNWSKGFLHFLDTANAISERDLLDGSRYPWMFGAPLALVLLASYEHHQEHLDKLLARLSEEG